MGELRVRKEAFVTGHEGTTMCEISLATLAVPLGAVLSVQLAQLGGFGSRPLSLGSHLRDGVATLLPSMLLFFDMVDASRLVTVLMVLNLAVALMRRCLNSWSVNRSAEDKAQALLYCLAGPRKSFLSLWRGTMLLTTCACILAVDFPAFPRRFTKAETYGTGLMDVGVGSFVLANAVLSRQARGGASSIYDSLRSVFALLVLGFGRLASTTAISYQVHVGEYGLHWNFFFTLAAVTLLTSLIRVPTRCCTWVGLALLVAYQAVLSCTPLGAFIAQSERGTDLVSLNKEGLFSTVGFWGLYLVGLGLASQLFGALAQLGNLASTEMEKGKQLSLCRWWRWVFELWIANVLLWLVLLVVIAEVEPVSRRSANFAYCAWVLAYNMFVILVYLTLDLLVGPVELPLIFAVNFNPLPTFLAESIQGDWILLHLYQVQYPADDGNLLTGVVNMSVNTLEASGPFAWGVMFTYLALISTFALVMHARNISIKL